MDTRQLEYLLYRHPATRNHFGGVLARNELPLRANNTCYIVNTDPNSEPGTHWIALYFAPDGTAEYFDSYGLLPNYIDEVRQFLEKNGYVLVHNNKRLQGARTAVCGQYCAYFLILRCSNIPMPRIVAPFSNINFHANDTYVRAHIHKLMNFVLPLYQPK